MAKDLMAYCPLLKKEIDDGICCEIGLVVRHDVKESFVSEVKDWEEARRICPKCSPEFK
ncbi:hypothetical protein [Acidaminococcus timonensis]|uniref:hypothetical protein n=1 Tax=Acidaminococcus timonensis TaxID=1871002 RepID=UPI00308080C7